MDDLIGNQDNTSMTFTQQEMTEQQLFKNAKFGAKYKTRDGRTAVFLYQEDNHAHVFIEGDTEVVIVASDGNYMAAMPYCDTHNIESPQDIIEHMSKQTYNRKYYEERKAKNPDFYKQIYRQNKERHLAACKRYRERHKEKVLEMHRKYRETHKEERKAYRDANRDRLLKKQRQWRLENGQAKNMLDRASKQLELIGKEVDQKLAELNKLFDRLE